MHVSLFPVVTKAASPSLSLQMPFMIAYYNNALELCIASQMATEDILKQAKMFQKNASIGIPAVAVTLRAVCILACLLSQVHGRHLNLFENIPSGYRNTYLGYLPSNYYLNYLGHNSPNSNEGGNSEIRTTTPTPTLTPNQPPPPPSLEPGFCQCPDSSVVSLHHPETGAFVCSGVLVSRAVVITFGGCLQQDDEGETMLPDVRVCGCEQQVLKTIQRGRGEDSVIGVLDDDSAIAVLLLDELIPEASPVSRVPVEASSWDNFSEDDECEVVSWGQAPPQPQSIADNTRSLLVQDHQAVKFQSTCIVASNSTRECFESLQPSIPFPEGPVAAAVVCGGNLLGLAHHSYINNSTANNHQYGILEVTSLKPRGSLIDALVSQAPYMIPQKVDPSDEAATPEPEFAFSFAFSGSIRSAYWFGRR